LRDVAIVFSFPGREPLPIVLHLLYARYALAVRTHEKLASIVKLFDHDLCPSAPAALGAAFLASSSSQVVANLIPSLVSLSMAS
jgi:hypothetical protein